jgi:hypothetical protein
MSAKKAKRPKERHRLSRTALDRELVNLKGRIRAQVLLVGAIFNANRPNGEHVAIEYDLRRVFGLQIEVLLRELDGIHTLASALCGAEGL